VVLRIFDCDLCMIATLDLLAHPHISIPYVQMGLITALKTSNLFSNDIFEFNGQLNVITYMQRNLCRGLGRPRSFQEAESVIFQDNQHMKVVGCLALHSGRYSPPRIYAWKLISIRR